MTRAVTIDDVLRLAKVNVSDDRQGSNAESVLVQPMVDKLERSPAIWLNNVESFSEDNVEATPSTLVCCPEGSKSKSENSENQIRVEGQKISDGDGGHLVEEVLKKRYNFISGKDLKAWRDWRNGSTPDGEHRRSS
jgi:hypothetical protein